MSVLAALLLNLLAQAPEAQEVPARPPLAWAEASPVAKALTVLDAPTSASVALASDLLTFGCGVGVLTAFSVWESALNSARR